MKSALLAAMMLVGGAALFSVAPVSAATFIDASQSPYNVSPTGNSTAGAQQALDDAFNNGPATVVFPTGFNFTSLATYPGITIIGGGENHQWIRTAAGPGLYTTTAPGAGYPSGPVFGVRIESVSINDGSGLAGANITIAEAQSFKLVQIFSRSAATGAEFTASLAGTNTMSVTAVTNGTLANGQLVLCPGCARTTSPPSNSYPVITPGGGGSGGTGTYWTTGYTPNVSSREMVAVSTWTWNSATLASAAIALIGSTFDGTLDTVYAGGWYNSAASGCSVFSGIGFLLDTTNSTGGGKPNHDTFITAYTPCANLGFAALNGSDGLIHGIDLQFDNYGMMFGTGAGNARRWTIEQPYFEGLASSNWLTQVGMGFDVNATNNKVIGSGSLSGVTTGKVDYGTNNCWQNLNAGVNVC